MDEKMSNAPANCVRLRGIPFSTKEDDVRAFLEGVSVHSVIFTHTSNGRASGECYVELDDAAAVETAKSFDRKEISGRYIEVFGVTENEIMWVKRHNINGNDEDNSNNFVVRLRGIPFNSTDEDIKQFFSGLDVADVVIGKESGDRLTGEAFVRLANKEDAEMALERNKKYLGSRYVEVFRSSNSELENAKSEANSSVTFRGPPIAHNMRIRAYANNQAIRYSSLFSQDPFGEMRGIVPLRNVASNRFRPYALAADRYRQPIGRDMSVFDDEIDFEGPTKVYMRGLPFNTNALDIEDFFNPLQCVAIKLGYNDEGRPSGDGYVIFSTIAAANEALAKDKCCIGNRYIELFPANRAPISRRYVTYRTVNGSSLYGSAEEPKYGYGNYGNYDGFNQINQVPQRFIGENESRRGSQGRSWGSFRSAKAAW